MGETGRSGHSLGLDGSRIRLLCSAIPERFSDETLVAPESRLRLEIGESSPPKRLIASLRRNLENSGYSIAEESFRH